MKTEPFVSVVVPTYNRKDLLVGCIESLIKQSYPKDKYEIIIVDDGSKDGTKELVEKYSIDQPQLKTFWQKNQGPSVARNWGIKNARGEIICFTDDDCIAEKDWIKNLMDAYTGDEIGGSGGKIIAYKKDSIVEKYTENSGQLDNDNLMKLENFIATANASYRKNILNSIGGFDVGFKSAEDEDIGIRVKLKGFILKYAPNAIVYHNHRTTLKQLIKQWYIYGKGRSFKHKKYTKNFFPYIFVLIILKRMLFKTFTLPLKLIKVAFKPDREYHFAETLMDIAILNVYLFGFLKETYFGDKYTGEKYNKKLEFIKE